MKIVIPGGTGQVGTLLCRAFARDGHQVVVLGRAQGRTEGRAQARTEGQTEGQTVAGAAGSASPARFVRWEPAAAPAAAAGDGAAWAAELEGADVVINLAGRSVNCRYTNANRQQIVDSRVSSVNALARAIASARRPPRVWLQASTATIYAHRYDAGNDERTGVIGGREPGAPATWGFSVGVARAWEKAFDEAGTPATRKVKLRSAMVMSPDRDGIFDTLSMLVRRGLGGTAGDGRQYVSWIHEADFVRAIYHLIERQRLDGAVNLAAPNPLPNREFMAALRRAWGARLGLPASRWMLELGAVVLRTETELVLKSRRVVPGKLLEDGFTFRYPEWPAAAEELVARRRQAAGGAGAAGGGDVAGGAGGGDVAGGAGGGDVAGAAAGGPS
jgi:uncharacterized protein